MKNIEQQQLDQAIKQAQDFGGVILKRNNLVLANDCRYLVTNEATAYFLTDITQTHELITKAYLDQEES